MKNIASALIGGVCVFVLTVPVTLNSIPVQECDEPDVSKEEARPAAPPAPSLEGREGLRELLGRKTVTAASHPLVEQRKKLGGHQLTKSQKIHFYALAIAELGPKATKTDFAMLMETAYNRGITEGDSNINQNLTRAYYEPLRKYRTIKKRYYKKIRVGKGKKRRTKRVRRYRTIRVTTSGWKNYTRYKRWVTTKPSWFKKLDAAHDMVLAGSNYSKLGTQNASAGVARSARRTQTVTAKTTTGETISRKDVRKYGKKHGYATITATKRWVKRTEAALAKYQEVASNE